MFDLSGKSALITGASGGLGSDIARALHSKGARVGLSGTRKDALDALAGELGERADVFVCDLHDSASIKDLATAADETLEGVDILVNNAAITRDNIYMRMSDEQWNEVLTVNLTAPFLLTRALLRGMIKRRWGRVMFMTSVVGFTGNPGQANYTASKAGLSGMARSLALEVAARNITVNCIAPGFMETPMTAGLSEEQSGAILARIPQGRMGSGGDIGAVAAYLASEEAGYTTGQTLHVNGGMAMV
ncbi:MAG: beta-ketoacyl-ACP reductase [Hyphomicrobiales bacterium]|nr:beta-ketoacyl-ACP reductase [Hyphomicrobiales bacterium]